MTTRSFKVSDNLYLVEHEISPASAAPKPVEVPVDHIFVYDCSGSMSWDLPKIREQVKKKLPKMLGEQDTLSAIWFSGKGQAGVLLSKEPVATAKDLLEVNRAVDRWLKPIGLTGFKEPLELAQQFTRGLLAAPNAAGRAVSLTFMSDGCDNQWPREDVVRAARDLGGLVNAATFVEYGYYADRALLAKMAEACGGAHIFAEDFDRYEPIMADVVSRRRTGAKKMSVEVFGEIAGGFAFSMGEGELITYAVEGGVAEVPEGLERIWVLSSVQVGPFTASGGVAVNPPVIGASYAAISLFALRARPDVVLPLLKVTGDARLIDQFATCFGKQRYSAFMEEARLAAFDRSKRLVNGFDPERVPADDAFTIMQLLEILQGDSSARLLLDDPRFKYSKIGRGRVDVTGHLSDADLEELEALLARLSKEKDVTAIRDLNAKIAALTEGKNEALKFVRTPQPDGYPILKLVYNEDRPNVSVLVKRPGTIDLSFRSDCSPAFNVPPVIDTFIYRSYTILKDGLLNFQTLPVRVSRATVAKLASIPSPISLQVDADDGGETVTVVLELNKLPPINRSMVKNITAEKFFTVQYELVRAQAKQKVYNHYARELLPARLTAGVESKYGAAGAAWLRSLGIGDGYNPPHTEQAPTTDFYYGKELKASLKGLSKLPSIAEALAGKGGAGGELMRHYIKRVDAFLTSDFYVKAAAKEEMLRVWLDAERKAAVGLARGLIFEIAQMTFTIVVGQTWFSDLKGFEDTTYDLIVDAAGNKIACKVEMVDVEIKV